jgi:hypothetical protein
VDEICEGGLEEVLDLQVVRLKHFYPGSGLKLGQLIAIEQLAEVLGQVLAARGPQRLDVKVFAGAKRLHHQESVLCVCTTSTPQTKQTDKEMRCLQVPQVEKVEQVVAIDDSTQKLSAELLERVDAVVVGQRNQRKDVAIVDKAAVTLSGQEEKKATGEREGVRKCAQAPRMPSSSSTRGLGWRQEGDRAGRTGVHVLQHVLEALISVGLNIHDQFLQCALLPGRRGVEHGPGVKLVFFKFQCLSTKP